jgi:hypothetical protein
VLSDQLTRWCRIDRLSWQRLLDKWNRLKTTCPVTRLIGSSRKIVRRSLSRHVRLGPMLRNFLPGAVLLAMIVASFLGIFLGWASRWGVLGTSSLPSWRKVLAYIGLFAVTTQAILFVTLWTPLARYRLLLLQSVNLELALLIVAVPCIFLGRLQRRWWLIASAAFLPVVSWFSVLAEVAY